MTVCLLLILLSHRGFAEDKPNIVLFFVDDLGWSDLGYRNPVFESPNIDALAQEGLSFEQADIACPTCSPSRATLLTGKHPARLKLVRHIPVGSKRPEFDEFGRTDREFNLWEADPAQFPCRNWLPLECITYPAALKKLAYSNLFIGGHPRSYYPPYFRNSSVLADEKERYLTDKLTDETVKFIEQYAGPQPFMISFWHYSVHGPHIGRKDFVEHFEAEGVTGKYAHYAAMVKAVDESIGRVRYALKRKGIEKGTIIVFLSDQGGYFENPPFHGGKRIDTLYEGGARVPFIFHWPDITQPGASLSLL
jgi:arylsulfatase A-like enzyme